jgi:hypothetical protein
MAMTQTSYSELADKTIRDFLKAVVLIDDHWAEAQNAPELEDTDFSQINFDQQVILPQENVVLTSTSQDAMPQSALTSITDPVYLREIGKEITNQGLLFTGFAYTDSQRETALKLASKADILILDWYLGSEDSRPALALLETLKNTGTPRFIFILTDQDLADVRKKISDHLGEATKGTGLVFNCGPFSFSMKNKPQAGGQNTVEPANVLNEAVNGIREQFGGLLQLAALQLLSSYKGKLHEVLTHFSSELDVPFIAEWLEDGSPIGPNSCFRSLMIDEWRSLVERNQPNLSILSDEGISAFIASKKDIPQWGGESAKTVHGRIQHKQKKSFPTSKEKLGELEQEIHDWMGNGASKWPALTKPKGISWKSEVARIIAWGYLSIACRNDQEYREQLVTLDAFFHTQSTMPLRLDQGTILKRKIGGKYLICITPTCDCARPETRINNQYSFLLANRINPDSLIDAEEGSVIAVRSVDNDSFLLRVTLKPSLSFQIKEAALAEDLNLFNSFSSNQSFCAKPIAQLRPARVQSLVSLNAGRAIEIGLERSEILRQLCKTT